MSRIFRIRSEVEIPLSMQYLMWKSPFFKEMESIFILHAAVISLCFWQLCPAIFFMISTHKCFFFLFNILCIFKNVEFWLDDILSHCPWKHFYGYCPIARQRLSVHVPWLQLSKMQWLMVTSQQLNMNLRHKIFWRALLFWRWI